MSLTIRKEHAMTPRPSPEIRADILARATAARAARDEQQADADMQFGLALAELAASYHGAQADIAAELGITRDAILKTIKRAKARQADKTA